MQVQNNTFLSIFVSSKLIWDKNNEFIRLIFPNWQKSEFLFTVELCFHWVGLNPVYSCFPHLSQDHEILPAIPHWMMFFLHPVKSFLLEALIPLINLSIGLLHH